MARRAVARPARSMTASDMGLWLVSDRHALRVGVTGGAYLLMRWGIKRTPGKTRNAGKVMRLKIPKTAIMPKMVLARREERCCWRLAS